MTDGIIIHSITPLARDWGRMDRYDVTHPLRSGGSQRVQREIYDHGSAAAVLLHCAATDSIVLIRQFRLPSHVNGDPAWMIEAPAGLLDGEPPDVAARREAVEETGYEPEGLQFLFDAYMSPGSVTEKCACFLGSYTPGRKAAAGGGLTAEGEDIEVIEIGLEAALEMIGKGEIVDAKTILLLQALALKLARVTRL